MVMENYINLLIISNDLKTKVGLKKVLSDETTTVLFSESYEDGKEIIIENEISVVIIDIEHNTVLTEKLFKALKSTNSINNTYIIYFIENQFYATKPLKILSEFAIDYIIKPINPNFIKSKIDVYRSLFLKDLKIKKILNNTFPENALHQIRNNSYLSHIDMDHMRIDILDKLKTLLPKEVVYHTISHTLNVEKVALKLAQIEGLGEEETHILQTAVLYHDAGYMVTNINNEPFAIQLAKNNLLKYGFDASQIDRIAEIILSTRKDASAPKSILQEIMQDADHDYFGRDDYYEIASRLRMELENYGNKMTDHEWILFQLDYLENRHQYYTKSAINIRLKSKNSLIEELKTMLKNQ